MNNYIPKKEGEGGRKEGKKKRIYTTRPFLFLAKKDSNKHNMSNNPPTAPTHRPHGLTGRLARRNKERKKGAI
jgi:hypothetical protein